MRTLQNYHNYPYSLVIPSDATVGGFSLFWKRDVFANILEVNDHMVGSLRNL